MENLQSESAVGIRSALLKRIKGLQMAQRLGFFSPLQYWSYKIEWSGSAVWSSSVLQKRIKDLQWLCSLDFFSPLRFGPSSYSPMSRVKSLKSGSAERTKGLQTYGVALQFWTQGIEGPFGF